jgi:pantoate--beta-alanine ligase
MQIIQKIDEMRKLRQGLTEPVGFVPTMGYLHQGHLSLIRSARKENHSVVVSIFVNPTQFGPREDFVHYPRDTERDLNLLTKEKVVAIFQPPVTEMYPERFDTWVKVDKLAQRLEGASRPEHFQGVATVVIKLLNIIQPDKAYFGQKDAQQALVIKKMVADLNMNLEIVTLPTVRETDGLAMSSRNRYLDPDERRAAPVLYQALNLAQKLYEQGERDADKIRKEMAALIKKEPLVRIEYVSIANGETLDELDTVSPPALVSLAAIIGQTRLIDNIVL